MTQFPDLTLLFKESQHWHQFLSHFPFVLWIVATILLGLSISRKLAWLYQSSIVMGLAGSLMGIGVWFTGESLRKGQLKLAFTEKLLSTHYENSKMALFIFSGVFAFAALLRLVKLKFPTWSLEAKYTKIVLVAVLAIGTFFLFSATQEGIRLAFEKQTFLRDVLHVR
jgi:hypothetical protein